MLTLHHLNNSRSQRILWLLEELELDYAIQRYERDQVTNLAPPELEAIHPLGKSPVLSDDANTVIESGAIIDYLLRVHGDGRLYPKPGTPAHEQYLQWLHYGEGSAALPLMLKMYTGRLPDGGEALQPRINDDTWATSTRLWKELTGLWRTPSRGPIYKCRLLPRSPRCCIHLSRFPGLQPSAPGSSRDPPIDAHWNEVAHTPSGQAI